MDRSSIIFFKKGYPGKVIQAYADEKDQLNRFQKVNNKHLKANMQSAKNIAIYFPFLEITRVSSTTIVIWLLQEKFQKAH